MKALPLKEEVQRSSQTYQQQTHAENNQNDFLPWRCLTDHLWDVTPGTIEADVTPEAWKDVFVLLVTKEQPTQSHERSLHLLAVALVQVHQEHALAVVHAELIKTAVAGDLWPRHTRAPFAFPWKQQQVCCQDFRLVCSSRCVCTAACRFYRHESVSVCLVCYRQPQKKRQVLWKNWDCLNETKNKV